MEQLGAHPNMGARGGNAAGSPRLRGRCIRGAGAPRGARARRQPGARYRRGVHLRAPAERRLEPFGPLHPRGYAGRFSVSELRYRPIRVLRELNLQQQLE